MIHDLSKDVKVSFTSFFSFYHFLGLLVHCMILDCLPTLFFIVWRSDSTLYTCLCSHSECLVLIGDLINWTMQDMIHGTNYLYHWIPFLSSFKWHEVFICIAWISYWVDAFCTPQPLIDNGFASSTLSCYMNLASSKSQTPWVIWL